MKDNPTKSFWFRFGVTMEALWVMIYCIPSMILALYYCFVAKPRKSVKGEIIMVTGAGQGLGRELCLSFARLGAQLVCVDLIPEVNQETVKMVRDLGAKARGYVCDVSDRTAIQKLAQEVGRVDILVNNAGIYPFKGLRNATEAEIRTIIDINMMSMLWTAQAFIPAMKDRNHGHFVIISSLSALTGLNYMEPYSISKAGLTALAMSLWHEMRIEKKDVKVSIAYPYFIKTRSEVKECCDLKLPAMELEDAVSDIVQGILEELPSFTVPPELHTSTALTTIYPQTYWHKWFETFYARISEPKNDAFKHAFNDYLNKSEGTIKVQD